MIPTGQDSLRTRSTLEVGGKAYGDREMPRAKDEDDPDSPPGTLPQPHTPC